jgi:cardiolipin synthase C
MSLTLLYVALAALILILIASTLALRSWNRFAARARGPESHALPQSIPATPLDGLIAPLEDAHPAATGLSPLIDPKDAFAARSLSAQSAARSLDLIYYIWSTDTSGWLLINDILQAADRGVRVRLLLDDVNVQGFDLAFLGLTGHPNIEVRLFNPIRNRGHWARRGLEFALGVSRFNRRMHGKIWIADNRIAILGGRNIGDTYFGAPGTGARFSHDVDMVLAGPLVEQASQAFDRYWNLGLSLPLLTLWPNLPVNQRRFRRRLQRHAASPLARSFRQQALSGRTVADLVATPLRWTTSAQLLTDPPEKALGHRTAPWLLDGIADAVSAAQTSLRMTTPYFVPGAQGLALLTSLARRGVAVQVLTNSLAVTDLFTIHAAYSHYRRPLLASGARLYEFAPPRRRLGRRDLLHAKVFLIDDDQALVGSHNFDLRSAFINIEFGLLFKEPAIVAELSALFDQQTQPDQSFAVTLENGELHWNIVEAGRKGPERAEPEAWLFRRLVAKVIARLPHGWF